MAWWRKHGQRITWHLRSTLTTKRTVVPDHWQSKHFLYTLLTKYTCSLYNGSVHGNVWFYFWWGNVGYHDNQKLRFHYFTFQSETTRVPWQCQNKPFNHSLELYAALTHLNKEDYVSELTWRQGYEHSGYFNPSLKLDQDVLAPLLCPPAREIYITFKIYLDYR